MNGWCDCGRLEPRTYTRHHVKELTPHYSNSFSFTKITSPPLTTLATAKRVLKSFYYALDENKSLLLRRRRPVAWFNPILEVVVCIAYSGQMLAPAYIRRSTALAFFVYDQLSPCAFPVPLLMHLPPTNEMLVKKLVYGKNGKNVGKKSLHQATLAARSQTTF
jgi:hypothetical protein